MQKPELVAHRGFSHKYPENSKSAFQAAIDCGCHFLELDVQITKDKRAIVIHDTNTKRTGVRDFDVLGNVWNNLKDETIGEVSRFGNKFENEKLLLLDDFVKLLQENPTVHAFVEIKEESIDKLSVNTVLDIISTVVKPVKKQCSLISFDSAVLFEAKATLDFPIGYVLYRYDDARYEIAQKLSPDILICNYEKVPDEDGSLWQGPWDWFLYEIVDPEIAKKWVKRGVKYIETMQIGPMIKAFR